MPDFERLFAQLEMAQNEAGHNPDRLNSWAVIVILTVLVVCNALVLSASISDLERFDLVWDENVSNTNGYLSAQVNQ